MHTFISSIQVLEFQGYIVRLSQNNKKKLHVVSTHLKKKKAGKASLSNSQTLTYSHGVIMLIYVHVDICIHRAPTTFYVLKDLHAESIHPEGEVQREWRSHWERL